MSDKDQVMLTETQVAEIEAYLKSIGELPKKEKSK